MYCIPGCETECHSRGGHMVGARPNPPVLYWWKSGHWSSLAWSSWIRSSIHGASWPCCIILTFFTLFLLLLSMLHVTITYIVFVLVWGYSSNVCLIYFSYAAWCSISLVHVCSHHGWWIRARFLQVFLMFYVSANAVGRDVVPGWYL